MSESSLAEGDRLVLWGGYDQEPRWLVGRPEHPATLVRFIPGQNKDLDAVVRLDEPIDVDGVSADLAVLALRYEGATWTSEGVVHIELCDFDPESKRWQDRRQGAWVEAAASYRRA